MSHKQAKVVLVNKTSGDLLSVGIVHKYSNDYKEKQDWAAIKKGEKTSSFTVNYTTGLLTTGQDWWAISWIDTKGKMYITDPKNIRGFVDFLETVTGPFAKLAATLSGVAITDPEPFSKAAAAALAITSAATAVLTNKESTKGFKSFILRPEDAGSTIKITIRDSGVDYHAKSGDDKGNPFKEVKP